MKSFFNPFKNSIFIEPDRPTINPILDLNVPQICAWIYKLSRGKQANWRKDVTARIINMTFIQRVEVEKLYYEFIEDCFF